MIRGTFHLTEETGGHRDRGSKDLARVEFVDQDAGVVIGLLEAVLVTLHARYEAQKDNPGYDPTCTETTHDHSGSSCQPIVPDVPRLPVATHNGQEYVSDGWLYRYDDGVWRAIRRLNSRQIALRETRAKDEAQRKSIKIADPEADEDDEEDEG